MRKVDAINDEMLDALQQTVEDVVEKEQNLRREDQSFFAIYLLETIVRLRRSEGKTADLLNAAQAAADRLRADDSTGLDVGHVAVLANLDNAIAAEKNRQAKRMWKSPTVRTQLRNQEAERGRQFGVDQCIQVVRDGVAARRTRAVYGDRFVKEMEAIRGKPIDLVSFPRMLSEDELKRAMGLPVPESATDAGTCSYCEAQGHHKDSCTNPRVTHGEERPCSSCGLLKSVHADAGGSRGLDGCKEYR